MPGRLMVRPIRPIDDGVLEVQQAVFADHRRDQIVNGWCERNGEEKEVVLHQRGSDDVQLAGGRKVARVEVLVLFLELPVDGVAGSGRADRNRERLGES